MAFIANENVTLAVDEGEIHALVGENGAGKSTLMKVLSAWKSRRMAASFCMERKSQIDNPNVAIQLGIGMVYQHFMLVPSLTVAENLIIGMEPRKGRIFYDGQKAVELAMETAKNTILTLTPKPRCPRSPSDRSRRWKS